ncbi:hypothetical protein V0288_12390 [Pannus brasiliensis CCIBt3594]|uniref:Uncharacterized protein n=1 Tax=Pannus brasiliensis CCIBt3594 TaxID=1427578 RepID=A0AAW9QWK7_9CHRO
MKNFLISFEIIQDTLLNRRTVEYTDPLWELLRSGKIKGYLTEKGRDNIHSTLIFLCGDEAAETVMEQQIVNLLEICPVDESTIHKASAYFLSLEYAIEVVCAKERKLEAIVTSYPERFSGIDFPVFSPDELLYLCDAGKFAVSPDMAEIKNELEKNYYLPSAEIKNELEKNYYLPSNVQLELFSPDLFPVSKDEFPITYNIRNKCDTVLKVLEIIRTQGTRGISYHNLMISIKLPRKTIESILSDLTHFGLVSVQNEQIYMLSYFLNYDRNHIADYIASILKKHIRTQNISRQTKPNKVYDKTDVRDLAYPERNESAKHYFSRMLSWLYFTGLLEEYSRDQVIRPLKQGKQKGKLKHKTQAKQLEIPNLY